MLTEFYNHLLEAIAANKITFVKGKRDMTGNVLRNNKELASLFSKQLDKVGQDPNRLTNRHMLTIYKDANPGLKKHIDNMKNQRGDYWYKPKNGFGFSKGSQLQHAKHITLAGDARLILTKLRDGRYDYSLTNHGAKGSADYQHVLDYIKKVRGEAPVLKKGDDPLTGKPKDSPKDPPPKKSALRSYMDREREKIARGDPDAVKAHQQRYDKMMKTADDLNKMMKKRQATRSTKKWAPIGSAGLERKKPSAFQRLKNVLGMK